MALGGVLAQVFKTEQVQTLNGAAVKIRQGDNFSLARPRAQRQRQQADGAAGFRKRHWQAAGGRQEGGRRGQAGLRREMAAFGFVSCLSGAVKRIKRLHFIYSLGQVKKRCH